MGSSLKLHTNLMERLWAHETERFLREPSSSFTEAPERPASYFVQLGHFTVSRLILALQDLQREAGDIPVHVQQESDWDREWEPIEQLEFERDANGAIVALRLQ